MSGRLSYRCHAVAIRGRGDSEEGAKVASRGLAPYPEPLAALMGAGGACWPIGLRKKQGDPGPAVFIEDGGVLRCARVGGQGAGHPSGPVDRGERRTDLHARAAGSK